MLTEMPNFATLMCMKFRYTNLLICVDGKLCVSFASFERQSCLNKHKNIFSAQSKKGFSAAFHQISSRKNCCVTYHVTLIEKVKFHTLCKFDALFN